MMDNAVQELLDKQALYELVLRYSRAVDRCDEEMLRSVYHPDAVDEHGTYTGGPDGFVDYMNAGSWSEERRKNKAQHVLTNPLFEVRGNIAFGECYSWVFQNVDGELSIKGLARVVDRYERRDGEWRIAHRRVIPDWMPPGTALEQFVEGFRDRRDPSYERSGGW